MGSLKGVQPGDELLLVDRSSIQRKARDQKPRTRTVHKVGTKLVHVLKHEGEPEFGTNAYRIDSGIINDGYGHSELLKPEDWEVEKRRDDVEAALRVHGVEVWRKKQPVPVLEKILAVLEGEL
jgi:GH24 family phage-related lysozyme (muramidase)